MDNEELELESGGDLMSQPHSIRKNIPIKLKAKGRGRVLKAGRGKKVATTSLKKSPSDDDNLRHDPKDKLTKVNKFDLEADISKLEAPTFTTIDRGPPEPMHRNTKLKWDHKVNLIGEKVVNPMIHCCERCKLPILIYGRMIPCKHVFCLECAKKLEKVCPRCTDKVQRVEQTGLGTVFMCTFGGSRHGNNGCRRTYLSQRDLQAHINHRHLRVASQHHDSVPPQQTMPTTPIGHHGPSTPSPNIQQPPLAHEYENRDPRELRGVVGHEPPPLRNTLPPPRHLGMLSHPPPPIQSHAPSHDPETPVLPPPRTVYHPPRDDISAQHQPQVAPPAHLPPRPHMQYTQPPPSHVGGYASSPIPVIGRTNLITVQIQDDPNPGYHSPHQNQYHQPPPSQSTTYPPPPQHPYSHPPPNHPQLPVGYTPSVYQNPPLNTPTNFSQPPPTHFPPPLHHSAPPPTGGAPNLYTTPPPRHPPPQYSGPQRFTPPAQYEDGGGHIGNASYSSSGWVNQARGPPPPRSIGPSGNPNVGPLQQRPPYYRQ